MPCAHYKLMKEYLKDCEKYERPWEMWQFKIEENNKWMDFLSQHPIWSELVEYRRKPRTITIPESELPEPMREVPKEGLPIFKLTLNKYKNIEDLLWDDNDCQLQALLQAGLLYRTEQDAIAWRDWWRENVMGRG